MNTAFDTIHTSKTVDDTAFTDLRPRFLTLLEGLQAVVSFTGVSILVEQSTGKNYRISRSGTLIKDNPFAATGAVIRLTSPLGAYEYSFNDFSTEFLEALPALLKQKLNCESVADNDGQNTDLNTDCETGAKNGCIDINSEETADKLCFNRSSEFITDPEDLADQEILSLLNEIYDTAVNYHDAIIDCICQFQYLTIHKMYLSAGKDLQQHLLWSTGVAQPLSHRGEKTHYYRNAFSCLGGAEILQDMKADILKACDIALALLDSTAPPAGTYDVICMPDVTGLIAHEAFGHGVEMDMFVKDRALAKNYIGRQIASPLVTMHDNALNCRQAATYFFDDEGTLSHDTVIIKDGILTAGISDLLSARALGTEPTGNGRRESYERKAYTRMTNTYFEAGKNTLEDMIASIEDGILLENGASGMEDPKNWGIQCMVNVGREIKNGRLTGKLFSPLCLSGYVPDLLKSISMVSTDLTLSGCGYCGKGYKEWVKVSDGGPAIKARVTLS